jgi:thiol-disulfide isomerase/thioredoxin
MFFSLNLKLLEVLPIAQDRFDLFRARAGGRGKADIPAKGTNRMTIRTLLVCATLLLSTITNALAADRHVFEKETFQAALDAGKPILVHVTAPWCVECQAQKPIVAALAAQPEYAQLTIFDVDFDTQKDALRVLKIQTQSTLAVFKAKAEVSRAVGITRRDAIEAVMKQAL